MTHTPDPQDYTPHFPPTVDNTMLSAFDACPQRFFNEFCIRLSSAGISPDLHAGGAFASALEEARRHIWRDHTDLMTALSHAWLVFTREWGQYEPPEANPKTYEAVFSALTDYFREYPPDDDPLRPYMLDNGAPALEFTFAIPLPVEHPETGEPIMYSGRFDMLAELTSGSLCVVDEKTTKYLGASWQRQWPMRGQFIGYVWAARMQGFNCTHFAVRGIGISKTNIGHLQYGPVPVRDFQIEDWYMNMLHKVEQAVAYWNLMHGHVAAADQDYDTGSPHRSWPKSYGEACSSYGGCQFVPMCSSHEPARMYADYERRVWDPLQKNPAVGSENRMEGLAGMTLQDLTGSDPQ